MTTIVDDLVYREPETCYSAVVSWRNGELRVEEPGAERSLVPFADNVRTAVDMLRNGNRCRINASRSVLREIYEALARVKV